MNLWRYDAACRALAEARAIDEVKDIRAKADALRAYARQAENRTLEIDASEIRIRAERRIGEIMAGHRAAGTLRPGAPRRLSEQSRLSEQTRTLSPDNPDDRVTLAACGINERLAGRARAYAVLTLDDFELRLARRRGGIERENARVGVNLFDGGEIGDLKKARRARRESELTGRVKALPDERFGVILDDPEWRFEVRSRETGLDRAADNHYPTSTLEDIFARDIQSIAAPDCAWFRWVTVPHLANGLRSVAVDGFEYKTSWVWAKDRIGNGYWNRNRHEILLLAVRGDVPCPAPGTQWDSLLEAPVGEHSAKPERFLAMIEAYFPSVPKIELNRRGPARPGWSAWGNEAEDDRGEVAA